MKRIEHVAIAVNDIDESNKIFEKILGYKHDKFEIVENEGVVTSFFKLGDSKIELVASRNDDSAIAKYLNKRSEGIHHIALYVDDIEDEAVSPVEGEPAIVAVVLITLAVISPCTVNVPFTNCKY